MEITLEQYAGAYLHHPDFTPERRENAETLLAVVNELIAVAAADGVEFHINPHTGSLVSGEGRGGFRPQDCPVGAPKSNHKQGHGVDVYCPLPERAFSRWCYAHPDELHKRGLSMENARWTNGWTHLQDVAPGPAGSTWRLDFVPSNDPPACAALPEQEHHA